MEPITLRERQKERRRNRIYAVAIDLFKRNGFQQTTATDIAKGAHVSRGTFFNYYPYKEAVLLDFGAELVDTLADQAERQLQNGVSPEQVLQEIFKQLAQFCSKDKDLFPPLAYEVLNPDPDRARTAYQALPLSKVIEMCLRPLKEQGRLRDDLSLERMCNLIADTFLMVALRWSAYNSEGDLEQELRKSLAMMLDGVFRR